MYINKRYNLKWLPKKYCFCPLAFYFDNLYLKIIFIKK